MTDDQTSRPPGWYLCAERSLWSDSMFRLLPAFALLFYSLSGSEVHVEQCLARIAAADAGGAGNALRNDENEPQEEEGENNAVTFDDAGASRLWGGLGAQPGDDQWTLDGSTRHHPHAELAKFSNAEEYIPNMGRKSHLRGSSASQGRRASQPMESGYVVIWVWE